MRPMTRSFCAALIVAGLGPLAGAQGADGQGTAQGDLRASDLIGQMVKTQGGETVGNIEDLLISGDGRVRAAIVEDGGFLGLDKERVTIPFERVRSPGDGIVLTEEEARALPVYRDEETAAAPAGESGGTLAEERDQLERQFSEWSGRMDKQLEEGGDVAREASDQARDGVANAWNRVKEAWEDVKAASRENWEAAKDSFNEALNGLERQWNELNREQPG